MSRKKETITLSIPPGTKEKLEEIAERFNIFWGKSPSISGLLVALAEANPEIIKLHELDSAQEAAVAQSIKMALNQGDTELAQSLLNLLKEQGTHILHLKGKGAH